METITLPVSVVIVGMILPLLYAALLIAAVVVGGLLVFKTKKDSDADLFGFSRPKQGGVMIAGGGPDEFGFSGEDDSDVDDLEDGTDTARALNVINKANANALTRINRHLHARGGN